MINYSNAHIENDLVISIDHEDSIPKLINLKSSYELVKSLRIMLNDIDYFK